jgi:tetraacyldisaccharide 4'-kinase
MEEIRETYDNWNAPNKVIVTTEKDATRLHLQKEKLSALNTQVIVLPIKISFLFHEAAQFDRLVNAYVEPALGEHRQYGNPFPV